MTDRIHLRKWQQSVVQSLAKVLKGAKVEAAQALLLSHMCVTGVCL